MSFSVTRSPPLTLVAMLAVTCLPAATRCLADSKVVVVATADPEYTRQKFSGEKPKRETYVVMQGHYFDGLSVDKSIERMSFRHIAEIFAPELGRREYLPAKNPKEADLLIVVHWGTTSPQTSMLELTARTSPTLDTSVVDGIRQAKIEQAAATHDVAAGLMAERADEGGQARAFDALSQLTDQISIEQTAANAAQLLGYTRALRQFSQGLGTTADEYTLRHDLREERYFIVLKAYDLHQPTPLGENRRAVWTLHLNMGSPGNNFSGALEKMSITAVNFVGRTTDQVETVTPPPREGKVEIGPLTIIGEAK